MIKVSIVGSGNVGATCAFLVAQKGLADVLLVDIADGLPQGKSIDIGQAAKSLGLSEKVIGTNRIEEISNSSVVIITAGFPRKPGMTRRDLLIKNARVVKSVVQDVVKHAPQSKIIMVTNPLDVMTYVALKTSGFSKERVLGMGGLLDSSRFAYFIAQELQVSVPDVSATVIGSHNDLMIPIPRLATVSNAPLKDLLSLDEISEIVEKTRRGGAEIVSYLKTGSAFYAPAACVMRMLQSIIENREDVLSVCTYLEGEYGLQNVCISVPAKVGKSGILEIVEWNLDQDEKKELNEAANGIKNNIKALDL